MKLLIKNGSVVTETGIIQSDILINQDTIAEIGTIDESAAKADKVIDAAGKYIYPGFIDAHVHLREPGFEDKETVETGAKAAAKGGFTTIFCMPNTNPVIDNRAVVEGVLYKAQQKAVVNVLPIGAITKGSEGSELAEYADMREAGIVAISDDGHTVKNTAVMRHAMDYAGSLNIPMIDHCEDIDLVSDGYMHEGFQSTMLGLRGIPSESEEIIVARDILLSKLTGYPIHLAHISAKGSVELIREAKAKGIQVTAEVTPHHLVLTDEAVEGYHTSTKCNPPLRTEADRQALIEGLKDGTIDFIASDHAPHAREDKEVEYAYAPFGMIGLETSVALIWDRFIKTGILKPEDLYQIYYKKAAEIFGLPAEGLVKGGTADITIIDGEKEWTVDKRAMESKAENTPFDGWTLKGAATATIVAGKIVMEDGTVYGK